MKTPAFSAPKFVAVIFFLLAFLCVPTFSQQNPLGIFAGQSDVGNVNKRGAATYDAASQTYTLTGSGSNMWAERDEFHFVYKRLQGNFILQTQAQFIGKGVEAHRKIGWIVRSSLEPNSAHVNATVHGDGLT